MVNSDGRERPRTQTWRPRPNSSRLGSREGGKQKRHIRAGDMERRSGIPTACGRRCVGYRVLRKLRYHSHEQFS
jgi:hypothetical protein